MTLAEENTQTQARRIYQLVGSIRTLEWQMEELSTDRIAAEERSSIIEPGRSYLQNDLKIWHDVQIDQKSRCADGLQHGHDAIQNDVMRLMAVCEHFRHELKTENARSEAIGEENSDLKERIAEFGVELYRLQMQVRKMEEDAELQSENFGENIEQCPACFGYRGARGWKCTQ